MDSDIALDMKNLDMKKKRYYKQRYLTKWETDWRFSSWLSQYKEDPDFAYCNICHTRVLARIASLIAHSNATKHKRKMKMNGMNEKDCTDDDIKLPLHIKKDLVDNPFDDDDYDSLQDFYESTQDLDSNSEFITTTDFVEEKETPKKRSSFKKMTSTPAQDLKSTIFEPETTVNSSLVVNVADDEFSVYGKHIANELRQISENYAQQTAKMKINTIMYKARTGHYVKPSNPIIIPQNNNDETNTTSDSSYQFVVCPTESSVGQITAISN